jgi:ATPase subunit of ABC transporter with duplicated ATPase domains
MNEVQQQAQFERQQAMLAKEIKFIERFKARASPCRAGAEPGQEARQDRARRAAQAPADVSPSTSSRAPRSGEDVASLKSVHKPMAASASTRASISILRRRERWCVLGINGAGKSTLLKLVAGAPSRTTAA